MREYEKSVIPIIESNYDNFTNAERTIADFFISNREKIDFSAKSITKHLFVSEASLSRFAQKAGYEGYREFIFHYQNTLVETEEEIGTDTEEVLKVYQELLNKTYNLIDKEQINRVTRLIAEKKRIFVYGVGSSGLVAQEFKIRFMRMGVDVEDITDTHLLKMNSVRLDKNALVIGISISGMTKEIIQAMESAREKKATTILLTSKNSSTYQEEFDEVLLTSVRKNLEYGNVISPQFPALIIMDIIYANFLKEDRKNREAIYDTTLDAIFNRNQ